MAQLGNVGRLNPRGVEIFPPGWEAHHRPVAEAGMTATVELWSGADPGWVWDEQEQKEVRDLGMLAWTGRARVQQRIGGDNVPAGDQQVTTHRYLVAVPSHVVVGVIAWVKVVQSGDPGLGLLKVVDVLKGSIRWERDLMCTDNLG